MFQHRSIHVSDTKDVTEFDLGSTDLVTASVKCIDPCKAKERRPEIYGNEREGAASPNQLPAHLLPHHPPPLKLH